MPGDAGKKSGERAIVIGSGIGGMMAAGVLARHFASVLVLEKDPLPATPAVRSGAPQGAHCHGLLEQGRRNAETIFPGLTPALMQNGAVASRFGVELQYCDGIGWHPQRDLEMRWVSMSRPLLEHTIRGQLSALPNVTIRDGATVTGWREDKDKITVSLAGTGGEVDADIVIDASGRAGPALEMLEAAGYGAVEEEVHESGMNYSSVIFEKPAEWIEPMFSCAITDNPPNSQSGFLLSIENNCWILTLYGRFDQAPPKDRDGFIEYAKNLSDPGIYKRIVNAKQVGPIRVYRTPFSKWRRYDLMARFPDRMLPLGDTICQYNPMFGQGMTAASFQSLALGQLLAQRQQDGRGLGGIAQEYLQSTRGMTEAVWRNNETYEFSFPQTKGKRPADIAQRQAFAMGLRMLIEQDAEVHQLLTRVGHMTEPGEKLGRKDIVERVMALVPAG